MKKRSRTCLAPLGEGVLECRQLVLGQHRAEDGPPAAAILTASSASTPLPSRAAVDVQLLDLGHVDHQLRELDQGRCDRIEIGRLLAAIPSSRR
jgi:hypothetical protein